MRKILVLRGGALGDFIVTLPALASLRQRWPEARIELVGNANAAELGRREGLIDAVHSQHEARWSSLYATDGLTQEFREWLQGFDLVISYWPDPDAELSARFPLRAGQIFLSGAALPARRPAAAHYCETLRSIGVEPRDFFHQLKCVAATRGPAADAIAIHPGSGSPQKNWPQAHWAALGAWLKQTAGSELLLVAGEAETEFGNGNELFRLGRVARRLPLIELAGELARCRLFLGHDSGVSHLAAACGVPCLLLFGPTDPAMWAPPAPQVQILRRGTEMNSIPLFEVQRALTAMLGDRQ